MGVIEDRIRFAAELKDVFEREANSGRDPFRRVREEGIPHEVLDNYFIGRRLPSRRNLDRLLDFVLLDAEEREYLHSLRNLVAHHGLKTPNERPSLRREPSYVPKFGQPDPIGVGSPAELQEVLNAVHVWGGEPSLRTLERLSNGVLRRSTVSDMLRGTPLVPDYDRYLAFLRACGVEALDVWVFTWRRLVALKKSAQVAERMGGMASA
ncbi:hypothetical protein [Streptomyces sp. NBC_00094]|uniref:hypothetical protein n=1 Tax=Streptomyces sp. NBC_00094 TaxID=2903620 RepID=UPI0022590497|nr:hypothetical protein [Streptomyces sp. NBC_00094]MCX5395384.1 hypothetical protein [Streptomyces sp. NBC_00094]